MVKGINKQIVEINYTKNDYIEKAILIINPEKASSPKALISKNAEDYMKTILSANAKAKEKNRAKLAMVIGASILLTVIAVVIISLI